VKTSPQEVIAALRQIEANVGRVASTLNDVAMNAETELARLSAEIESRLTEAERELRVAEYALAECENSYYVDDEGNTHYPDCSAERQVVWSAQENVQRLREVRHHFDEATSRYHSFASAMHNQMQRGVPATQHWLRQREAALIKFENSGGMFGI